MKTLRIVLIIMVFIAIAYIGSLIYKNRAVVMPLDVEKPHVNTSAEFSLENPHFVESDGERVVLELDAEKAYYFQGENKVELIGPKALFFSKTGRKITVSGQKGVLDSETNDLTVTGDVVMDSAGDFILNAQSIDFKKKDMTVFSEGAVALLGAGFLVKGKGLKAYLDKESFIIYKNVDAVFEPGFKGAVFGK